MKLYEAMIKLALFQDDLYELYSERYIIRSDMAWLWCIDWYSVQYYRYLRTTADIFFLEDK